MIMKPYQNFVFDLYGTLVDIHTEEGQPSFWRSCSRYLGMQGVHYEPGVLRQKYEQGVKALEEQKRLELPQGAEPEIDIGAVFGTLTGVPGWRQTSGQLRILPAPSGCCP